MSSWASAGLTGERGHLVMAWFEDHPSISGLEGPPNLAVVGDEMLSRRVERGDVMLPRVWR